MAGTVDSENKHTEENTVKISDFLEAKALFEVVCLLEGNVKKKLVDPYFLQNQDIP
jgi:adenylate cyclase class IV